MPFSQSLLSAASKLPEDPVRLRVSGSTFTEWFEVDIDSDIFTPADAFSLTGVIPDKRYLQLFREGATVDVDVGDDRQMNGIIDDVEYTINRENARISIAGRDRGSYLVDSETKAQRFSNYTLKTLAEALLLPEFGIKRVIGTNDANRRVLLGKKEKDRFRAGGVAGAMALNGVTNPGDFGGILLQNTKTVRKQTKIDPGQTIRQVLDEHCHRAGVTWWMTAAGDLFIGKPEYNQPPAFEFYCYAAGSEKADKVNNILPGFRVRRALQERYSEITVVGESAADSSAQSGRFDPTSASDKRAKKYKGSATDPDLVARGIKRKLIVVDHDALSSDQCKKKAEEDQQRRRLSALVINLEVPGFKQDGKLFTVDTLAKVVIEEAGIDGIYWISQRRFSEKRETRRTQITLHEKGVYLP